MFAKLFLSHSYLSQYILTTFLLISLSAIFVCSRKNVDYTFCPSAKIDKEDHLEERGLPLLFMGKTFEKKYYLTTENLTADFFQAAFSTCEGFGLTLASVKTVCEYGIVEQWFLDHFPTDYSIWVAGMRFGDYLPPKWITTGVPMEFSEFGFDLDDIPGPYYPGSYNPIEYPWVNCLSVSRNCPLFTGAPTNPCEQTKTYPPGLQFAWEDCREEHFRVICEKISYSKADLNLHLDENDIGKR